MRKIANFLTTTLIFGGASYAYIYYKTSNNLRQHNEILEQGRTRDASRLSNTSFGISWGFQADDIIMNKLDSGDYLFIKFDCSETLNPLQFVQCYADCMWKLDEEWDTIGFAYRNSDGLFIIYNQFGATKVVQYSQLVSLPYLKALTIQKNNQNQKKINFHKKLKDMLQKQDKISIEPVKQSALEMANRFNRYFYGQAASTVIDIRQLQQTSQQILVRTQTNRTLRNL